MQRRGLRLSLGAVGRAVLRVEGWSDAGVVLSCLAGATPTLRRALRRYCARLSGSPLAAASAPPAGRGEGADRVDRAGAGSPGGAVQPRRHGWDAAFTHLPTPSAPRPGGDEESSELPERVWLPLAAGALEVTCLEILRWLRDGRSVPALSRVSAAERHGLRSAAESLHEADRADAASAVFEVAAGLAPGDGAFRAAIGRYYLERGALCSALGWIRDAVELSPTDPGFCQLHAETFYQMGDLEAARNAALRAATLDRQGQPGSVFQLQDLLADIHAERSFGERPPA